MGVWNDWSAYVEVPADRVAPLAAALREHRSGWSRDDGALTDPQLIVRAILDAEGDEGYEKGVSEHLYDTADDGSLEVHVDGYGKLGDSEALERVLAQHGADGSVEGEADGTRYRVRIKDGERREYGAETVYPNDPEQGPVGTVWSLSVYDGAITTTLHASEAEAEAALRGNYDQEPADYAGRPLVELVEALWRRDSIEVSIEKHVLS